MKLSLAFWFAGVLGTVAGLGVTPGCGSSDNGTGGVTSPTSMGVTPNRSSHSGAGAASSGNGPVAGGGSSGSTAASGGTSGSTVASGGSPSTSGSTSNAAGSTADVSTSSGTTVGTSTSSGSGGASASSASGTSGGTIAGISSASSGASSSGSSTGVAGACGSGDAVLAAAGVSEPSLPSAASVCQTIPATRTVAANGVPDESTGLDTQKIQTALSACKGKAVKLVASGANNALVTGSLAIDSATLWVDAGVTLYASRGALGNAVLTVTGTSPAIVGEGVIDGQGGEPRLGGSSWWVSGGAPPFILSNGTNFVMYRIQLHNSPGFHVKLTGTHFIIWGTTLLTPSKAANSAGTPLTPYSAHNTDGIDPGSGTHGNTTDSYIVCNTISVGDDHIAVKGGSNGHVSKLTIAHNHFGAGHGMSIGSETGPGGVEGVNVYDLTVDGAVFKSNPKSDLNGIRIKSYQGAGGLVNNISYTDLCTRDLVNPILLEPNYTSGTASGGGTPQFTNITVKDYHFVNDISAIKPVITLNGYDSSHMSSITLDNVVVEGSPTVTTSNTTVTIGPGGTNFSVPGVTGSGTPHPIDCTNRFVPFPITFP